MTAQTLSMFLNRVVQPWVDEYNMRLSTSKCHSFLFSLYYHNPWPAIYIGQHILKHGSKEDPKKIRILGLWLDRGLTMTYHVKYILAKFK